jgi:YidC/Oxa1 family membrane protein insertase
MEVWQWLLDQIGAVLAWIYHAIPSYGIAIIILTILVRLVLLPLGIKQIRSMHAMQAVQPKIKAIQNKYKNDKQKSQEEIMKVYKEHGVNPLGGCLPLLLQMPVLISLYAVLRFPPPLPAENAQKTLSHEQLQAEMIDALHVPAGSSLQEAITAHTSEWVYGVAPGLHFAGANLLCSASEAGQVTNKPLSGENAIELDCGRGVGSKIPIYFLILLMVGTTYFQQWQMQRASPPGAAQKQQQTIARIMPLMFLFFFWRYPSGMVLYWATSNLWQIGQQHFLLKAIKKEQTEGEKPGAKSKDAGKAPKRTLMQRMMEQAEAQKKTQNETKQPPKGGSGGKRPPGSGNGGKSRGKQTGSQGGKKKPESKPKQDEGE